jgi:hypothetical protein
MDEFGVLT